jgi:tetratricopeptide (TPR) repeat protein
LNDALLHDARPDESRAIIVTYMSHATAARNASLGGAVAWISTALMLAGCAAGGPADRRPPPQVQEGTAYPLMMAEIAVRRGAYGTAAEEYVNAAERSDDPSVSQRAAEYAADYGYDAFALRAARRWVMVAPDSRMAHRLLARLLIARNEIALATEEALKSLPPPDSRRDDDYLGLTSELGQGDSAPGLPRVLTRIRAVAPPSAALDLALAAAALGAGDYDIAIDAARRGRDPAAPVGADALIARALVAKGQAKAGVDLLESHLGAEAGPELQLEHARLLAAADRRAEAIAAIDAMAAKYPGQAAVIRLKALLSLDAGDRKAAWDGFNLLLANRQFPDECLLYLGQIAEQEAVYDDALQAYGRVTEGPYLHAALMGVVRIAEKSGDTQTALDRVDEYGRDYPRHALTALRDRAGVLLRANRPAEALAALNEVARFEPHDVSLRLIRSEILDSLGRTGEALADLRTAAAGAPDNALALNALGYTLANRTSATAEAYRLVRRALEIEPESPAILDSLGWVYFRQGRLPEARSYLQAAYSVFPDPEVAAHLGEVIWRQGGKEEARRLWQDALEKNPTSRPLKEAIARLAK